MAIEIVDCPIKNGSFVDFLSINLRPQSELGPLPSVGGAWRRCDGAGSDGFSMCCVVKRGASSLMVI
jgi:hypothetical protein